MKKFRYHIFSIAALLLCATTVFAWWRSTRVWEGHYLETPYGIFSLQTESSLFVVGAKFMQHDHRWYAWSNADPIWNDSMKWIRQAPRFQSDYGKYTLMMPYWQLSTFLGIVTAGLFYYEWRRRKKLTEPPPPLSSAPKAD